MADDIVTRLRKIAPIHEGRRGHGCIAEAADEIERLRAAGDSLAMHLDAHYGLGAPCPSDIRHALVAWQEVRRG